MVAPTALLFVIAAKLEPLALTVKTLPGTVVPMTETSAAPATLKARLRADLTTAMKARDSLTTATLRLALAAITTAEVSGSTAKELTDAEVITVLGKELRKRAEAAEAFAGAGRPEQAAKEEAEAAVLTGYLPKPLTDAGVGALV